MLSTNIYSKSLFKKEGTNIVLSPVADHKIGLGLCGAFLIMSSINKIF